MHSIVFLSSSVRSTRSWSNVLRSQYKTDSVSHYEDLLSDGENSVVSALLIIDSQINGFSELDFKVLKSHFGKLLVIGESLAEDKQIKVILAGASGYVEKSLSEDLIVQVVESVLGGEIWLGRHLIPKMIQRLMLNSVSKVDANNLSIMECLTEREKEVVTFINCGESNQFIAESMTISSRTVKAHLAAIYRKLKVDDRFQLVVKLKDAHIEAIKTHIN